MQKYILYTVAFLFLFLNNALKAQNSLDVRPAWSIILENGDTLYNSSVGGLNNPQFSTIDLNNDGREDLFIFERVPYGFDGVAITLLNVGNNADGSPLYIHAPEYQSRFPNANNFMLLRDYNCDNIKDVFAFSGANLGIGTGIQVRKGYYDITGKIAFTLMEDDILYDIPGHSYNNVLGVLNDDIPAIEDFDGDGDLDVLNFNFLGGWIDLFTNTSQEDGFGCDSLHFIQADDCWGRIFEPSLTNTLDLSPSKDSCARNTGWHPMAPTSGMHSGSTLAAIDMEEDGDLDLALGDIQFTNVVMAYNGGNADTAFITSQDDLFPSNSLSVNLLVYPAVFFEDVTGDGRKDMIVSPNAQIRSENKEVGWLYENIGTGAQNVFEFRKKDFVVGTMLDHGGFSRPAFFDHNRDGLMDLVVGQSGYPRGQTVVDCSLQLYENQGTATDPKFVLVDNDYAGLKVYSSQANINYYAPTFGDLDGDGDLDMVVGLANSHLMYCENTGGSGTAVFNSMLPNWEMIEPGQQSTPYIFDVDQDGLLDLAVGEKTGNINFYKNIGSINTPKFSGNVVSGISLPTILFLGGIDTRSPGVPDGYSAPCIKTINGQTSVFVGNRLGTVRRYDDVYATNGTLNTSFSLTPTDSLFGGIDVGYFSTIDVADINADGKLDYAVGNDRGGLNFYSEGTLGEDPLTNIHVSAPDTKNNPFSFNLFPNPAGDYTLLEHSLENEVEIKIFQINGALVYSAVTSEQQTRLNTGNLSSGFYCVTLTEIRSGKVFSKKLVVK